MSLVDLERNPNMDQPDTNTERNIEEMTGTQAAAFLAGAEQPNDQQIQQLAAYLLNQAEANGTQPLEEARDGGLHDEHLEAELVLALEAMSQAESK